ncbi:MAG: 50S ribosomal protein L29 [Chloroflexi bacterium]|nr:50S ribosomal protein L29 [Chloroflexota bacterium]
MKAAELKLLSGSELATKLEDARQEYMNLRFQIVSGQLTDTSRLKKLRRTIAQYETILREQEIKALQEGTL